MAHQVAIDRPSHKFVSFLKKYYGLKNAIPQVGQKSVINGNFHRIVTLVSKYKCSNSVHIPRSIHLLK